MATANVNKEKVLRAQLRRQFTKTYNELDNLLKTTEEIDDGKIKSLYDHFEDIGSRLFSSDSEIQEAILNVPEVNEEEFAKECDSVEEYRGKWFSIRSKIKTNEFRVEREENILVNSHNSGESANLRVKRKFNLPKLELKKFDGDIKNWLGFWCQFSKIHDDEEIDPEDKFQYLLQSLAIGSSPKELVDSFPPTGENYYKAIDQIKARFARDDVLIEVYVRELLNLVLQQATSNKSLEIRSLYDKLETQLRALSSLGVTSEKYASMLQPLVESALPDDILRLWERQKSTNRFNSSSGSGNNDCLQMLLDFIRTEVESEERVALARSSFTTKGDVRNSSLQKGSEFGSAKYQGKKPPQKSIATASAIVASESKRTMSRINCLYCGKFNHNTHDCFGLRKLNYNEKVEFLKKKGACFQCLSVGHSANKCKVVVSCFLCDKRHCTIMCTMPNKVEEKQEDNRLIDNEKLKVLISHHKCETLLQTLIVKVKHNGKSYLARALLDSGSQKSYISKESAVRLGLTNLGTEVVNHSLFGGVEMQQINHSAYVITLQSLHNSFQCKVPVLDQEVICNYVPKLKDEQCFAQLRRRNILLTDNERAPSEIKILLGADILGVLYTGAIERLNGGLVAVGTRLGWTVMGKQPSNNQHSTLVNLFCSGKMEIPTLWDLDVLGIKDPLEVRSRAQLDAETLKQFNDTITINEEQRYEVSLLWKDGHAELLDNKTTAQKRLISLTKKLVHMGKLNDYDGVLQEWLSSGVVEEVQESVETNIGCHYLPHHAVIKESSETTKIRPVFDASAKDIRGNSLNSCLEKGPNLVELIPSVLLKFRLNKIGLTSDITKAFLQICLAEKDREYLRFLWWKDYETKQTVTLRHRRVVFGLTSSPFLLGATIQYHLSKCAPQSKDISKKLSESFYVDNCVTSVNSIDELERFVKKSTVLMADGKFELRGWISSCMESENISLDKSIFTTEKVVPLLGLLWETKSDKLFCDTSALGLQQLKITKRHLLSAAQKLFDPIGFTCPVSLVPKLLLQEVWRLKLAWDEELPSEIKKKFYGWVDDIHWLNECGIPRRVCSLESCTKYSLHVFCDASKLAYAACVFLRSEYDDQVDVQLLTAKSRISPIKQTTIPRLELLAAVIGSRLYVEVKEKLDLKNYSVYFWTDSMVVLSWIKVKGDWNTFVANRCKEICLSTNKDDWSYIPSKMNIADLPSRGCTAKTLSETKWWEGPKWLREKVDEWPKSSIIVPEIEVNAERKKMTIVLLQTENQRFTDNLTHFSVFSKIVRVTAWILRFCGNVGKSNKNFNNYLTVSEINTAEDKLIQLVQKESWSENDMTSLNNLPVFIDDKGSKRVKTRLLLSEDLDTFKYPVLLPANHKIVSALIFEKHLNSNHVGVQTLLVLLREKYWILKGRKTVRSVLSKCTKCKRFSSKPGNTLTAPLPIERISSSNAFEHTGVDMVGPLYLKNGSKAYIVLFTCATYRAVHLELTESLTTDAFLSALRRFIARRGRVTTILTDNGTNFQGAYNLLKNLDWNTVISKTEDVKRIIWKFNPPSAPWWGGFWERMVRLIKELLRRNLGTASVTYEELLTLLCDCESIINSRPLTYLSESTDDLQPLTPAMFLQPIVRSEVTDLDNIDSAGMNKRLRYLQTLRKGLRERFKKEYIAMLVNKTKENRKMLNKIKVGDIVLVGDDNMKRIKWPLAIVLQLFPGKDGISRVAKVRTSTSEFTRPIQRLYPLEIESCDIDVPLTNKPEENSKQGGSKDEIKKITRSGRKIRHPRKLDL